MIDTFTANWKAFYQAEMQLFNFLSTENLLEYMEGCLPDYSQCPRSQIVIPPKYVRCIIALSSKDYAYTYQRMAKEMLQAYNAASNDLTASRLPDRFPQYFENVERIILSINDAHSSTRLLPDKLSTIAEFSNMETVLKKRDILSHHGISCQIKGTAKYRYCLQVDNNDLMNYLGTDQIQIRMKTGESYRARLHFKDDTSQTVKYGLIIIDESCPVYHPLPRKKRSDKHDPIEDVIILPGDIKTCLYFITK